MAKQTKRKRDALHARRRKTSDDNEENSKY
jgi:hypothetical protein